MIWPGGMGQLRKGPELLESALSAWRARERVVERSWAELEEGSGGSSNSRGEAKGAVWPLGRGRAQELGRVSERKEGVGEFRTLRE